MKKRNKAGLTLFELMVVLAILGIILGVVYVNIEALTPRTRLQATCREMGATLLFARERAIASGHDVQIRFDLTEQKYFVVMNKMDDDGKLMDETEETELKAPHRDVRMENVFIGEEEGKSSGETILSFNEAGVSPGLAVQFSGQEGRLKYSIRMNPITGLVQMVPDHVKAGFVKESIIGD